MLDSVALLDFREAFDKVPYTLRGNLGMAPTWGPSATPIVTTLGFIYVLTMK